MKTRLHPTALLAPAGSFLLIAVIWLAPTVSMGAPPPSTRQQLIDRASPAVTYSYWWGHGCWRTDGQDKGSCSGSCPNCTHTGSYGADCSGFVAKVWQVPSASDVTENAHPYSTHTFRYDETYWTQIDRANAQMGDALVYRNSSDSAGHIVLFESGDPWGDMWTYEARGCSYGIVHNLRSLGSTYVAIERDNLTSSCTPDCSGRECGPDPNCNQSCGTCGTGEQCNASGQCVPESCTPDCSGLECGPDPVCGTSCGTCAADETCNAGRCDSGSCTPNCWLRECGPDPNCNESCGTCPAGETCDYLGRCVTDDCTPDCSGLECGPDPVCGTPCGTCPQGMYCTGGNCILEDCTPDCSGRQCGPDPNCNMSCGICDKEEYCNPSGQCTTGDCTPNCSGRQCGPDPACGTSCGSCSYGEICNANGQCITSSCTPDCSNRQCGLDPQCGMLCGTCPPDQLCNASGQCVGGNGNTNNPQGTDPMTFGHARGTCNASGTNGPGPLVPVFIAFLGLYLGRRKRKNTA